MEAAHAAAERAQAAKLAELEGALAAAREEAAAARIREEAERRFPPKALAAARSQHELDALRRTAVLVHRVIGGVDAELLVEALDALEARMAAVVLGDGGEWAAASALEGGGGDPWLVDRADEVERARRAAAQRAPAQTKRRGASVERRGRSGERRGDAAAAAAPAAAAASAKEGPVCFGCGGRGHLRRECPSGGPSKFRGGAASGGGAGGASGGPAAK
jgi:hypothetical protein